MCFNHVSNSPKMNVTMATSSLTTLLCKNKFKRQNPTFLQRQRSNKKNMRKQCQYGEKRIGRCVMIMTKQWNKFLEVNGSNGDTYDISIAERKKPQIFVEQIKWYEQTLQNPKTCIITVLILCHNHDYKCNKITLTYQSFPTLLQNLNC